eukprot:3528664-Pleurochrysis_carterae.AAC.1
MTRRRVTGGPVRVGKSGEGRSLGASVTQPHGTVVREIIKYAFGGREHVGGGTRHGAAEHAHRGTDKRLVCRTERRVGRDALFFGVDGLVNAERQVISRWGVVSMKGRRNAVRKVVLHELSDVFFLFQKDTIGVGGNVDV